MPSPTTHHSHNHVALRSLVTSRRPTVAHPPTSTSSCRRLPHVLLATHHLATHKPVDHPSPHAAILTPTTLPSTLTIRAVAAGGRASLFGTQPHRVRGPASDTTSNSAQPARRPRPDMTPTNTHTHPPRPPRVSATPHHARSPQPRTHPPEYPHNHQYTPNSKPSGPLSDPDRASRAQSRTPPDPLRSMRARWLTCLRKPKVRTCSTKIRSHNHDVTSRHMDTRTACWLTQGCRKAAAPAPLLPLRHAS